MKTADPSALFVITGDHSERFNFAREVGPNVASTIPIIFTATAFIKIGLRLMRSA